MYKIFVFIFVLLFLTCCNKHSNVNELKITKSDNYVYQNKPFELEWKIEKNSITKIPAEVNKKIKNFCKNHNRFVLIKIKTFKDDTAKGTFDCRI